MSTLENEVTELCDIFELTSPTQFQPCMAYSATLSIGETFSLSVATIRSFTQYMKIQC